VRDVRLGDISPQKKFWQSLLYCQLQCVRYSFYASVEFLSSIFCTMSFPLLLQQPPHSTTMFPYVCKDLLTFHVCAVLFPSLLWPPCVADADIIFSSCGFFFFLLLIFFPRLISVVTEWMSTILLHMVWP